MRHFFSRYVPDARRVLLVESGSRGLIDALLPGIYSQPVNERVDLLTCFGGVPGAFDAGRGEVLRTSEFRGRAARARLYAMLRRRGYNVTGVICSGEPVMARWKWAIAWQVPAKVFVLNENGDYFWLDWSQWRTIRHFMLFRAGLTGAEGAATLVRLAIAPFVLLYLLTFAAYVHLRRAART